MINCTVVSATRVAMYKDLMSVVLPAYNGQMQILPGHAEGFFLLDKGNIIISNQKWERGIQIQRGICYVKNSEVVIVDKG